MSRYTIKDFIPGSPTTSRIYGPDGAMVGGLYSEGEAETEQLKRWIEAAPESDGVMDGIISPTTYRIYGPDGAMIGTLFGEGEAETMQLKHYIEAHDEVMNILRNVGRISKRGEIKAKADELIARIDGEEE
jgi:hypothetical protein